MRELYKSYQGTTSWEDDPDKLAPNLKIVVLKYMFTLNEVQLSVSSRPKSFDKSSLKFEGNADRFYETLKFEVGQECERVAGAVEKVTVFEVTFLNFFELKTFRIFFSIYLEQS